MNTMRRKLFTSLAIGLLALSLASSAMAYDVLVWATGNGSGSTQGVANYLLATGILTSVTASNNENLTLADLLNYDAVLFFTNSCGGDMNAIGDILADYADTGRRLVLATFVWANQGCNTLGGRIISDQISPFVFQGTSLYTNVTMQSNDGHPYFAGVNALSGYFHDDVMLVPGAVQHATWSDGEPLLADKGNVVAVNLFPDDSFGNIGGDYDILFANCLAHLVTAVEEASWGTVKALY